MARIKHLSVLLLSSIGLLAAAQNQSGPDWPLHDNGLSTVVQWDHYSFQVHGQRIFIFSGEFHYWRVPVPELWRDILEKIKAAGFTAFAFYSSWAYHAPNNHTVDFHTGAHDITPIFELAKELGMYMIVRPGPYVNAEASAGGFPLWATTGAYGSLRNDDPRYTAAGNLILRRCRRSRMARIRSAIRSKTSTASNGSGILAIGTLIRRRSPTWSYSRKVHAKTASLCR